MSMAPPLEATLTHEPEPTAVMELMRQVQRQGRLYIPPEDPQTEPTQICTACTEEFGANNMALLHCAHQYCRQCLTIIFETAIANEASFPPRCCGPITIKTAHSFLDRELVKRYIRKKAEFETRDRMHCHRTECNTFIHPSFIDHDLAICPECGSATCIHCTREAHELDACPTDAATAELLRTAEKRGWKRCWSCRRMVELSSGCPHMICICGGDENGTYCVCDPVERRHSLATGYMSYIDRDRPNRYGRPMWWRRQLPLPTRALLAPAASPLPQVRTSGSLNNDPDAGHVRAPSTPLGTFDELQAGNAFDRYDTTPRPWAPLPAAAPIAPGQAYTNQANANAVHHEGLRFLTSYAQSRTGTGGYRQRFADIWPWPLRSSRDANDRPQSCESASSTPANHTASDVTLTTVGTEPTGAATSSPLTRSTTQGDGGRGRDGRNRSNRVLARFNLEDPVLTSARALRRARVARRFPYSGAPSNPEAERTGTADLRLAHTNDVAATNSRGTTSAPMRLARLEEEVALFD
ncbi:hypothetical protein BDW68DRAFT_181214 [Aspergillus falconensis]